MFKVIQLVSSSSGTQIQIFLIPSTVFKPQSSGDWVMVGFAGVEATEGDARISNREAPQYLG